MRVALFKNSEESFLGALDDAGIEYVEHAPTAGRVQASGTMIGIAQVAAVAGPLAAVVVAWIKARASRKVIVTLQGNEIVHLEGYTVKQVQELLPLARDLTAIDTQPQEVS